jgi:hypothetical protein
MNNEINDEREHIVKAMGEQKNISVHNLSHIIKNIY